MSYFDGKFTIDDILGTLSDDAHDYPERRKAIKELFDTVHAGAIFLMKRELETEVLDLLFRLSNEDDYEEVTDA